LQCNKEAQPLIDELGLENILTPSDCLLYSGSRNELDILISVNGKDPKTGVDRVGKVPAALNTSFLCKEFPVIDLLVGAGTAGGFSNRGSQIGDVCFSSTPLVSHDQRIEIPNFDEYGIGAQPSVEIQK